ncbi:MAG: hypothetical protein R6T90_03055, partial [Dissulfuribacterales bacterium]
MPCRTEAPFGVFKLGWEAGGEELVVHAVLDHLDSFRTWGQWLEEIGLALRDKDREIEEPVQGLFVSQERCCFAAVNPGHGRSGSLPVLLPLVGVQITE